MLSGEIAHENNHYYCYHCYYYFLRKRSSNMKECFLKANMCFYAHISGFLGSGAGRSPAYRREVMRNT